VLHLYAIQWKVELSDLETRASKQRDELACLELEGHSSDLSRPDFFVCTESLLEDVGDVVEGDLSDIE
jgi:hypothetical protein